MSGAIKSDGNPAPPKKGLIDALLLDVLGRQTSLAFGLECGAATLWMLGVLVLRSVLAVVIPGGGALALVPHGFIFAFPTGAYLGDALVGFPLFEDCFPVLPIRIAETILGRIEPARLLMVVPAQLLGSILGTVIFAALVPFAPQEVGLSSSLSSKSLLRGIFLLLSPPLHLSLSLSLSLFLLLGRL